MSTTNGHSSTAHAAVTDTQPVVLLRYRPGVAGQTARIVHLVPLSPQGQTSAAGIALCGTQLHPDQVETVPAGQGVPCSLCLISHVNASLPPTPTRASIDDSEPQPTGVIYQAWGWPVTVHRNQVRLSLDQEVSAVAIPIPLCIEATRILTAQQCTPTVLAHPYAPEHQIVLTGERYGITLPWPGDVHQVTGVLLLPPTMTPRGPITWTQPPQPDSLSGCREIDLFGALRTATQRLRRL